MIEKTIRYTKEGNWEFEIYEIVSRVFRVFKMKSGRSYPKLLNLDRKPIDLRY